MGVVGEANFLSSSLHKSSANVALPSFAFAVLPLFGCCTLREVIPLPHFLGCDPSFSSSHDIGALFSIALLAPLLAKSWSRSLLATGPTPFVVFRNGERVQAQRAGQREQMNEREKRGDGGR